MDLLDSIMSNMAKPPVINSKEKQMMKEKSRAMEEARLKEKEMITQFRKIIEDRMVKFIEDKSELKKAFEPMDVVGRSVIRDTADVAGLIAHVFGTDEEDRYVMVFKKEYPLTDDELNAYKKGEEYDPLKIKQEAEEKEEIKIIAEKRSEKFRKEQASKKSLQKYERLLGKESAVALEAHNRVFGYVNSELKKDKRTIEQTLDDIRAKKKLKINEQKPDIL